MNKLAPPFRIRASWRPRAKPGWYDESYFTMWDEEARALFRFVAQHEGELTLQFGDLSVELELDDLPMVFGKLPAMARSLSSDHGDSELYFASQGTALRITLHRTGNSVAASFQLGSTALEEFDALTDQEVVVDADSFLHAWLELRERILAHLEQP